MCGHANAGTNGNGYTRSLEIVMLLPSQTATLYNSFQNQGLSLNHHYALQLLQKTKPGFFFFFLRFLVIMIPYWCHCQLFSGFINLWFCCHPVSSPFFGAGNQILQCKTKSVIMGQCYFHLVPPSPFSLLTYSIFGNR